MLIDPRDVDTLFRDCLFQDGEPHPKFIKCEGIRHTVGLHPGRVAGHKAQIEQWLDALPDAFREEGGGGWSFLEMCHDRNGALWTGSHLSMEQLLQLGMAIGRMKLLMPRDLWDAMPSGVPYVVLLKEAQPVELTQEKQRQ